MGKKDLPNLNDVIRKSINTSSNGTQQEANTQGNTPWNSSNKGTASTKKNTGTSSGSPKSQPSQGAQSAPQQSQPPRATQGDSRKNQNTLGNYFGNADHSDYYGNSATEVIACDPEQLMSEAVNIQKMGQEMNQIFKDIYSQIESLNSSWYGKSYSKVCKDFNKIISDVNKMDTFAISQIPDALAGIARSFASADGRSVIKSFISETSIPITLLSTKEIDGFRFITDEVEVVKNSIPAMFETIKSSMKQIISILDSLSWNGFSKTNFKREFENISRKLESNFEDLINRFDTHFYEQVENVKRIESANMFM